MSRKNPFKLLPFNTRKKYVVVESWAGTKIYIPVNSRKEEVQEAVKARIQYYLDSQLMGLCESGRLPVIPAVTFSRRITDSDTTREGE